MNKEKCELNVCDGSGIIKFQDGSGKVCGCKRFKRARELFLSSDSPEGYQFFIDELEKNPLIQNITKAEKLKERNELNQDSLKTTFSPLKKVLKQFDDGLNGKPIKRFIKENYRMVFFGDTGTAKTSAAISLAYEGGKRNVHFYYLSMHKLHQLFRYDFYNEEAKKEVENKKYLIENADILIIDDLGKEVDALNLGNDNDVRLLKQMHTYLDGVLRSKKRLVITTTNSKPSETKEKYAKYDPRLFSMLFDGNVLIYQFREKVRKEKIDSVLDDMM